MLASLGHVVVLFTIWGTLLIIGICNITGIYEVKQGGNVGVGRVISMQNI